jgi:cytochrome c
MTTPYHKFLNPKRRLINNNGIDLDVDIPDGNLEFGKAMYARSCANCHSLDEQSLMGPPLRPIYQSKSALFFKVYNYSDSMRSKKFIWTKEKLFRFLKEPEAIVPDTYMAVEGVKNTYENASIIEYLKYLKSTVNSSFSHKHV